MKALKRFVPLNKRKHDRKSFDCGSVHLNVFLREKADNHYKKGVSLTMVLPEQSRTKPKRICAFYTLSHTTIERNSLPTKIAKTLPSYPIPVLLLAQLAVHSDIQKKGMGKVSLILALRHCVKINKTLNSVAIVVDAIDAKASSFYQKYGFDPLISNRLFLPMCVAEALLLRKT